MAAASTSRLAIQIRVPFVPWPFPFPPRLATLAVSTRTRLASYGLCLPTRPAGMPPLAEHELAAAAATSALGVAFGVRLLVALSRSRALKPLAAATSAAAAALRTPRALATASSPVAAILAASKAASKSYKAARTLGPAAARLPSLPSSKRLKAALAAASLLRLAAAAPAGLHAASPAGVAVLAVLKSSYKLSKNTSKVVEGFLGLQLHKGFRNGIDALGVVVKVAVIVSEVAVWVGARFWGYGRARCVMFLGFTRPTGLVLLGCSKSEPQVALFDPVIVGMDAQGCELEERGLSELFSLAVPVPQATTLMTMS
ncbi:hypothetical protein ZEAMMB73_Zm00001d027597 [Zea mays]|jgi:hypothetical protein|uniref:Uncharacterized protein n=2 Tax=Zea mays TaxID=4577 RepID=A0A1D6JN95_MAIZE|nr:hypothetical protein ZEAMMB73_Zm00001d027597 [Zea mays]